MTGDMVDTDPVVNRDERLGGVVMGAGFPGGGAGLLPHGMGVEDLPGLVFALLIIAVGGAGVGLLG